MCLDRTDRDFGHHQVNALFVTVGQGAFQVPLFKDLLDNRSGNSRAANCINLLQVCVQLLGRHRSDRGLGYCKFAGQQWLKGLKDHGVNFTLRLLR